MKTFPGREPVFRRFLAHFQDFLASRQVEKARIKVENARDKVENARKPAQFARFAGDIADEARAPLRYRTYFTQRKRRANRSLVGQ